MNKIKKIGIAIIFSIIMLLSTSVVNAAKYYVTVTGNVNSEVYNINADSVTWFCGAKGQELKNAEYTFYDGNATRMRIHKNGYYIENVGQSNTKYNEIAYVFSYFYGVTDDNGQEPKNIHNLDAINVNNAATTGSSLNSSYRNLQRIIWGNRLLNVGNIIGLNQNLGHGTPSVAIKWYNEGREYSNYIEEMPEKIYNIETSQINATEEPVVEQETGYVTIGTYKIDYDDSFIEKSVISGIRAQFSGIEDIIIYDPSKGDENTASARVNNVQLITAKNYSGKANHKEGYRIDLDSGYKYPHSGEEFYIRIPYSEYQNLGQVAVKVKFKRVSDIQTVFHRYDLSETVVDYSVSPSGNINYYNKEEDRQDLIKYYNSNIIWEYDELDLTADIPKGEWTFEIDKIDSNNKYKISDAYFTVKIEQRNTNREAWNLIQNEVQYRTQNGKIIIKELDCYGYVKFTIKEIEAPNGYTKLDEPIEIIVYKHKGINGNITGFQINDENKNDTDNGVWHEISSGNPREDTIINNSPGAQKFTKIIENTPGDFQIKLFKFNSTGNRLRGATFEFDLIKNGSQKIIVDYKAKTNGNGNVFLDELDLSDGDYDLIIREESAPSGYRAKYYAYKISFEVRNGRIQENSILIKAKANKRLTQYNKEISTNMVDVIDGAELNIYIENSKSPTGGSSGGWTNQGFDIVLNKVLLDNSNTVKDTLEGINFDITMTGSQSGTKKWNKTTSADGKITLNDIMMGTVDGEEITLTITENLTAEQQKLYGIVGNTTKTLTFTAKLDNTKYRVNRYYIVDDSWSISDSGIDISDPSTSETEIEELILNVKNTGDNIKLGMNISGKVFIDELTGKDGSINGFYDAEDGALANIEVTLLYENGNKVTSNVRGDSLTNPIRTNENGEYEFLELNPMQKYRVKFIYNGQEYEDTTYFAGTDFASAVANDYNTENWDKYSKALEDKYDNVSDTTRNTSTKREDINIRFDEIKDYPNSYTSTNSLNYVLTTNAAYSKNSISQMYEIIELVTEKVEAKEIILTNNINIQQYIINNISNLSNSTITQDEAKMMLQYIEDCKVSAYTDVYPAFNTFTISDTAGKIIKINQSGASYEEDAVSLYEGQNQINFGLSLRPEVDLRIADTVNKIEVHINENTENGKKKETYTYSDLADAIAYLRTFDIQRNTAENETGIAYYDNVDDLNIYVTHKIRITNESETIAEVTDFIEYYDSNYYTFDSAYDEQGNQIEVGNISDYASSGKYLAKKISISGTRLGNGNEQFVYVKLKMNANAQNASEVLKSEYVGWLDNNGKVQAGQTTSNMNYVEISGYKTYNNLNTDDASSPGLVDRDSIAGSFSPVAYEDKINNVTGESYNYLTYIAEDDTSGAQVTFKTLTDDNPDTEENEDYNSRYLSGNVFEDLRVNLSEKGIDTSALDFAKLLEDGKIKNITGITVELVEIIEEKDVTGNIISYKYVPRAKTKTGEDGSYTFTDYIPGNYVVRFTYGDTTYTVTDQDGNKTENAIYNGQHYQSTYANLKTNGDGNKYWYDEIKNVDGTTTPRPRYSDAYDKVQDRQTVIKYANEALVSDGTISNLSMNYYKTKLLKNEYEGYTDAEKEAMIKANTMQAYTSTLELEVENATTNANAKQDVTYNIPNVDFGLIKRAEAKMTLEQQLSHITITKADGSILIDTPVTIENGKITLLDKQNEDTVHFQYVGTPNSYGVGTAKLEIDDEILIGNIDLEYTITVRNDAETAPTLTYYKDNNNEIVAIGYYEEEKEQLVYWENNGIRYYDGTTTGIKTDIQDGATEVVKTKVKNIINYVSTNLNYDYTKNAEVWNLIENPVEEFKKYSDNYTVVNNEAYQEYNQILLANFGSNRLLQDNLEPHYLNQNGERSETLVLSATNTQDVDLNYYNVTEILELSNDAGRVDAESTPGNLDPRTEHDYLVDEDGYYEDNPITLEREGVYSADVISDDKPDDRAFTYKAYEPDSSQAEHVLITDATGNTHYYYVLIGTVLIIFAAGVILIKKFVLDKNS